jgi:hypothetical protein
MNEEAMTRVGSQRKKKILLCVIIVCSVTEEKLLILSVYFVNGINTSRKTRRTSFGANSMVVQLITKFSAFFFFDPKEPLRYLEDCH